MSTSRLIWGIICLALAGLLAVLNFVLPPEKLMFMVGDTNAPFLPPIILGILGIVLLATAARRGEEKPAQAAAVQDPEKADLNKRLETMAWGLFLIMRGHLVDRRRRHHAGTERRALLQPDQNEWLHHFPGRDFTARRRAATVRAADLRGCGLVDRPWRVLDP
ncbi:MAG: hypothetical protein P8186_12595 [Anaerolineae bacterium]